MVALDDYKDAKNANDCKSSVQNVSLFKARNYGYPTPFPACWYSPVKNPRIYRQEFLKSVVFLFTVMPLVERGLVNLVPDPGYFNAHLREQTYSMAKLRAGGIKINMRETVRMKQLAREDFQRSLMSLSEDRPVFQRSSGWLNLQPTSRH